MGSDFAGGSIGCQVRFEVAVSDFERFLLAGKGTSVATQECYARHVRAMLVEICDKTGIIDLGNVSVTWVRSYVTQLGGRYAPQSLKLIATAVRSFLRYAWLSGWTAGDLSGAVGPVITHRSGRLPRALAAEDVRRLLASPDCRTTTGLRDYALLTLLSRLGLRAGEAARLCLDDFDWCAATVTAKVKGGGRLRLPIPADVGPVVVAYLQRRPAGASCREVFVLVRGEPRPMTSRAVTQVVARHAVRAGLGTVRAHRLRHSNRVNPNVGIARATSPTSRTPTLRRSSPRTAACYRSNDRSGCPRPTSRPGRSTTTPANRSKPT